MQQIKTFSFKIIAIAGLLLSTPFIVAAFGIASLVYAVGMTVQWAIVILFSTKDHDLFC